MQSCKKEDKMANQKSTYEVEVRATVRLTSQDIDDIMSASLDGGVTAEWCRRVDVMGQRKGEYASDEISRGNQLLFYLYDNKAAHALDLSRFLSGVRLWIEHSGRVPVSEDGGDTYIDAGEIDAADADEIVQYALFGELVYG